MNTDKFVLLLIFTIRFIIFDNNMNEECEQFLNSKSSVSGSSLKFT